jgi:hypothetical protein
MASGKLTFEQSLKVANNYLANFGVELTFGDHININYAYDLQAAMPEDIDQLLTKQHLYNIVDAFSRMPLEYVEDSGIQQIILATQTPGTKIQVGAYIFPSLEGEEEAAFVYNLSSGSSKSTIFHEFWHRWDYLLSGGYAMYDDPYFEQLKLGAPYGNGMEDVEKGIVVARDYGYLVLDDYDAKYAEEWGRVMSHVGEPGCLAEAAAAAERIIAIGNLTVFISPYAAQLNVVEHKAEIGEKIGAGNYYDTLNIWTPAIREQFLTELARLANYRPNIAAFFVAMADRRFSPQDPHDVFQRICTEPQRKGGA